MYYEKVDLYDYFGIEKPSATARCELTVTVLENSPEISPRRKYPAILIISGGSYSMVSDREAEPVAREFSYINYSTFELRYSVAPNKYPTQLIEAAMAMAYIRENTDRFNLSGKVAAIGFSAGGHLCASLGTLYDDENVKRVLGAKADFVRPDVLLLCYPVISNEKGVAHDYTFENVSGGDKSLREYLSLEKRVTKNTPPTFLMHTYEDNVVPFENSIKFAEALKRCGVPFELHIFEHGVHGLSVCNDKSDSLENLRGISNTNADWVKAADKWLKLRNFSINE